MSRLETPGDLSKASVPHSPWYSNLRYQPGSEPSQFLKSDNLAAKYPRRSLPYGLAFYYLPRNFALMLLFTTSPYQLCQGG